MRALIAGGGTGGHIYPGIALAEEILRTDTKSQVLFVGTKKGLEAKILPVEGYSFETIPAGGIVKKGVITRVLSVFKLMAGVVSSFSIIRKYNPHIVIGVGGYASVPVLVAAIVRGMPTVILEQNLLPGLANRIFARFVDRVVVAFEDSKKFFKQNVHVLGNPVRRRILEIQHKPDDKFIVFISGGSQGAHAINKGIVESLEYLKGEDIRFIHQTGVKDYPWVKEAYAKIGMDAEVTPYLFEIERVYARANIVVSRSGATTVAELTACGLPSILIPYPHAINDHQRINAEYLTSRGCAEMILERELTGKLLAGKIKHFYYNRKALEEMSRKSSGLYNKEVSRDIVMLCEELRKEKNSV